MISLIILLSCFSIVISSIDQSEYYSMHNAAVYFEEFIKTYGKEYSSEEEKQERFEIFKKNLEDVNKRNSYSSDNDVYGITKFSDLTHNEYMEMHSGLQSTYSMKHCPSQYMDTRTSTPPEELDWRKLNKVTSVKDQKDAMCGSCWAFSAVGNIEGQVAIKYNQLMEFSPQQLVDCDKSSFGCRGGFPSNAFIYVKQAGGIMAQRDYPYTARTGTCRFNRNKVKAKVVGCTEFYISDEEQLKDILHQRGPLSIGVYPDGWQSYRGGIMNNCRANQLTHAVLLVGYGTDKGVPYWLIKNSSGPQWGEAGYIRVRRNMNACNMTNLIVTSLVA